MNGAIVNTQDEWGSTALHLGIIIIFKINSINIFKNIII
jgi:hypothetical protein